VECVNVKNGEPELKFDFVWVDERVCGGGVAEEKAFVVEASGVKV